MNTKQNLAYIAIGGLLVATGMIISPLNAQKDKFGDIECTKLTVRGPDGQQRVKITADDIHGGRLLIFGNKKTGEYVAIDVDEEGGDIKIFDHGSDSKVRIGINEYGHGVVNVWNKDGYRTGKMHQH